MATHSNPDDPTHELILGPVKIFDGLFMGDELAAKVTPFNNSGYLIHHQQQSYPCHQHSRASHPQPMGKFLHPLSVGGLDREGDQCMFFMMEDF